MTVTVESEEHKHRPRIYIPDAISIVSLYTMSHLLNAQDNFRIYYTGGESDDDLVKKICPRAIREANAKGMERSVLFLREEEMKEEAFMAPLEGNHRFVLIISMIGAETPNQFPFAAEYAKLEQTAMSIGYESYCILRLPPIFQHLNALSLEDLEALEDVPFYAIDADDVGCVVSQILLDPELHRGEKYTIFCHSPIPSSTLKAIHSQLPSVPGSPLQSAKTVIGSINSSYWKGNVDTERRNDFNAITGDEEMTSFEEFLRRTSHSLFHQRFLTR
jgi:hypothetical protein